MCAVCHAGFEMLEIWLESLWKGQYTYMRHVQSKSVIKATWNYNMNITVNDVVESLWAVICACVERRGGRYGKNIILRFKILCHIGFTILQVVWAVQPNEFPYYKAFQGNKEKRMADIYNNNNNFVHLYRAFLGTQSTLHRSGGISSTTSNVQHPPGGCDGSHSAPECPPHNTLLVERRWWSQSVYGND